MAKYSHQSLSRALAEHDHSHGLDQNEQVENERVVLDVVEVILQLTHRLLDCGAIRVAHLRPSRDSRLDAVPNRVERNLLSKHVHEFRTFGSRSDKAHLAPEYVDQLRQ